ncbi:MAG: hypothetical protein EXX96DRAFT_612288 [Benjaminiella poitrasii]|nr:MAG: hypothetical protein EXX96DRAFT_612288 [Benjaminiella poitrasii]
MSTISKTSSPPRPRKEVPLFRSSVLGGSLNNTFRHLLHHSVCYQVPKKNISPLHSALAVQLRELFPIGVGLGLTSSDDANGTNIEIALGTKADCDAAIASPVVIKDLKFHASPAVHSDQVLLRINLTKLPIWNLDKLRNSLLNNLARYGVVREITIYLDDWSSCWFTGNGHVYVERPNQNDKSFEDLSYKIPFKDGNTFCLGTWSLMGEHCVYCTVASTEKRRCYQCGNSGHIARNCFRAKSDDTTSSKRRREPRPSNKTPDPTLPHSPPGTLDQLPDDTAPSAGQANTTGLSKETDAHFNVTAELPTVIDTGAATASKTTMISERPKRTNADKNTTLKNYFPLTPATKPCRCGGMDHQRTTSLQYPLNKKNLANGSLVGGTTSSDNDNEDNHENGHDSKPERIISPAAALIVTFNYLTVYMPPILILLAHWLTSAMSSMHQFFLVALNWLNINSIPDFSGLYANSVILFFSLIRIRAI